MPFFAFRVKDAQGLSRTGKVQASTPEEARALLEQRGLRVLSVGNPSPVAIAASAPEARRARPAQIRTRRGSHKARAFLYSQLESMTRAGMNMHLALQQLANSPYRRYREPLRDGAAMVQQGASLADAMDRYPDLYLPSDAATVRVGETAGRLPEALGLLSKQAFAGHSFGLWLFFVRAWVWALPVLGYLVIVLQRGMFASMDRQEAAGGTLPAFETFVEETGKHATASLAWLVPVLLAFVGLRMLWYSPRCTLIRHRMASWLPTVGAMVRAESLARFYWALGTCLRAGLSPHAAYRLAVESVPNAAIAERLHAALGTARESTPLSALMRDSGVIAAESISMIMTGEQTGESPGMLERMTAAESSQQQFLDSVVKRALLAAATVSGGVVAAFLLAFWYQSYFKGILERFSDI